MKRLLCLLIFGIVAVPARAEPIRWVDFGVKMEALQYAMEVDIATFDQEKHLSWIDILALAACRSAGACPLREVKRAAADLKNEKSPEELLGESYKYYDYYHRAYSAVLGGFLGSFAIWVDDAWQPTYGLKAFSPIAQGYSYTHTQDFGAERNFGFRRPHLGNDLMGALGTPIIAVEGGIVEALGWNRYGGWRVGIRSFDSRRYYYYAHLKKDAPFAPGLSEGDVVQAGDLLGFMGRTGYSHEENTDNIEVVHLHFGMQLIFEESQKECDNEIWIDVYELVRLLQQHSCTLQQTRDGWQRRYPYKDLDIKEFPEDRCLPG